MLSKIAFPVELNADYSALEAMSQQFGTHALLQKAAETTNPVQRLKLVAA